MSHLPAAIADARPLVFRYIASSGALATAAVAQLATFAILARALGPKQFGLYIQFAAGAAVAVQLCGLGASDSLIRWVSRERETYPALLGHTLILVLTSGLLLVTVGAPVLHWRLSLDPRPAVDFATAILLLLSNVVLMRLLLLPETIFLSLGRTADANRAVVGFALARTLIAAVACHALAATTVVQWAAMQFCGFCVYAALCCWWLRGLGAPHWRILQGEIRPGLLFASQCVARAARQNADLFILGTVLTPATIGSYGIARRISDTSFLSIDAMNRLLYPRFSRSCRGGLAAARPAARQALGAALLLGAATGAAMYLAAPLLLRVLGPTYASAVVYVRIFSGLIIFTAVWSVAVDLLGASNHHGARASIMNGVNVGGGALVLLASSFYAVPGALLAFYGIEAATVIISWCTLLALMRRSA